jgi:asparagine synthase (glutamine-hydrolysing)
MPLIADGRAMVQLGIHRGPDGSQLSFATDNGFNSQIDDDFVPTWCVLGHSRLTILDLSEASSQPFNSKDGRYSLVFNGEIYNYIELREELQSLGVVFRSSGDSEVLLEALIAWGTDAIPRLRGMFAFAFADSKKHSVLLARDRYGIKPLHYHRSGDSLYFASEIKQFTALQTWEPKVNEELALQFLLYGLTDHRQETMFQTVERVMPGHFVQAIQESHDDIQQIPWYKETEVEKIQSYEEASKHYADVFVDSIKVHLRSDVPVGSCLSGGLDSSSIVGVAKHFIGDAPFHTFTATSEIDQIDETRFVEAVVDFTGAIPHYVQPTNERLIQELDVLTWHQDEPFGGTSIFAQWCVFQLVKETEIKVVLDGQGADEQLAGYNSFLLTYLSNLLRSGRIIKFFREYRSIRSSKRITNFGLFQFFVYQTFSEKLVKQIGSRLKVASQNGGDWICHDILSRNHVADPFRVNGKVPQNIRDLSDQMLNVSNLPMLLRFEDRNSMAHSIESRVPFVDRNVIDSVKTMKDDYLIDGVYTKRAMRDGLSEYLPEVIRLRTDKIGFQTAEEVWMQDNAEVYKQLVRESIERCGNFFSKETLNRCNEIIDGEAPFSPLPWRVISFGVWAKVFQVHGC